MRDPTRIDLILNRLREVWKSNPDWRFGQLIINLMNPRPVNPQLFYLEDSHWLGLEQDEKRNLDEGENLDSEFIEGIEKFFEEYWDTLPD